MPKRLSEHLAGFHKHAAAHHETLAKCYGKIAGVQKSAKSEMKPDEQSSLAECLNKIAETHEAASEYHKAALEECTKATEAGDLEKRRREDEVEPLRVSAVVPDRPTIQAVPRTGGKPMPVASHVEAPLDFRKLSGLDELDVID
jgi:hypothetical protein